MLSTFRESCNLQNKKVAKMHLLGLPVFLIYAGNMFDATSIGIWHTSITSWQFCVEFECSP